MRSRTWLRIHSARRLSVGPQGELRDRLSVPGGGCGDIARRCPVDFDEALRAQQENLVDPVWRRLKGEISCPIASVNVGDATTAFRVP